MERTEAIPKRSKPIKASDHGLADKGSSDLTAAFVGSQTS
jgi:hypothetical protein